MSVGQRRKTTRRNQPAPAIQQPAHTPPNGVRMPTTAAYQPELDRALDEYWGLHLKAQASADEAGQAANQAENEARNEANEAARLRQEAQAFLDRAAAHEARAAERSSEARMRQEQYREAASLAGLHSGTVDQRMAGTKLVHPRERFQHAATSFKESPLDAPLPPPLVSGSRDVGETQSFPAQAAAPAPKSAA